MADASYQVTSFLSGEWSQSMQGRSDRPDYRAALNVCLNAFPLETGAWVRRPGTMHAGTTRAGAPGREIKFDFQAAFPYNMEFTDGHLQCRAGGVRVTTNDTVGVAAVSAANPAVVQTSSARAWANNDEVFFSGLGATSPLLQGRVFTATRIDSTHYSLVDAITGAAIDGATLGWVPTGGVTVSRVLDIPTPYSAGLWSTLRSVQAEHTSFLLNAAIAPYAITVTSDPTVGQFATFSLDPAVFNDGPYLDPFINGVQANPSAKVGIISIALSFPAYSATKAYAKGVFATYSSVNYESRVDQNVGNQPDTHPAQWAAVNAGEAIAPGGFQGSDVGRLVRLFSEPAAWAVGTTYAKNDVVSYNPSGDPGAATYWSSLVGTNTGNAPGADLVNWTLMPQGAAIWTWGKITSLTNMISGTLAGSAQIGDMTTGGGLAAAFDGSPSKTAALSAGATAASSNSLSAYVGKNYSGATDQTIGYATIYPSTDNGLAVFTYFVRTVPNQVLNPRVTLNLRAKASAPVNGADGTLLGSTGLIDNTALPVTILSSDTATAWKYVWVEIIGETQGQAVPITYSLYVSQLELFSPAGTATSGNGVNVEILGPPLLYTTPINTWRLGVYSNSTGWPTCGTYHEGRLWLSGVIENRIDASVANGIVGGTVNFAPTNQYGQVLPNSAISYVFNASDTNPIFWMIQDLQGIICGTKGGEWLVQAPTPGSISPTNIAAKRVTKIRCANLEPRRTEHTIVFVQAFNRKIMEYFADVYSGKFTAPHLSYPAKHLTVGGIDEIEYQQELSPTVWSRVAGALRGCTYKRDTLSTAQGPTIAAWHRHVLGSGRSVTGLCVGRSLGGSLDALSLVTADDSNVHHVEIMTDILDEGADLPEAWLLDNAVTPSSTVVLAPYTNAPYGGLTLNGLWHLNGKTVTVFAGGLDCGDWLVTNGSTTVSFGDGVSGGTGSGLFTAAFAAGARIIVGFTYTSDGQLVRPASPQDSGARNGPALGKTRRNHQYGVQVDNTKGMSIGTDFTRLYPIPFKSRAGTALAPLATFSGVYWDTILDDYSFDAMLCWRITRPYPAMVVSIAGFLHTQDR